MAHVDPMMEEDDQLSFGPSIGEKKKYSQTTNMVVILVDTYCQEVLELDRIVLQEVGKLEEHGFFQSDEGGYFGDGGASIFGSTHQ